MTQSLYEIIGETAVNTAVEVFYHKVLADARINRFFVGVDMDKLIAKQKAFLIMVLGGPNKYTGKDVRTGHAHLEGLNDTHIHAVIENLASALKEAGVKDREITKVTAIVTAIGHSVRNAKPQPAKADFFNSA